MASTNWQTIFGELATARWDGSAHVLVAVNGGAEVIAFAAATDPGPLAGQDDGSGRWWLTYADPATNLPVRYYNDDSGHSTPWTLLL